MEDLSLHILDIAENALAAGATLIQIRIIDDAADRLTVGIEDNGKGMAEEFARQALDPFCTTRTTRTVGLGLSLLEQAAVGTGGGVSVRSTPGQGTTVTAWFRPGHIDMKPLGNIADTIAALVAARPGIDVVYSYTRSGDMYRFDTRELRTALAGVPLNAAAVLEAIRGDILEGMDDILKGRQDQNPPKA
jgi:hypothetical protein